MKAGGMLTKDEVIAALRAAGITQTPAHELALRAALDQVEPPRPAGRVEMLPLYPGEPGRGTAPVLVCPACGNGSRDGVNDSFDWLEEETIRNPIAEVLVDVDAGDDKFAVCANRQTLADSQEEGRDGRVLCRGCTCEFDLPGDASISWDGQ
jgi:hypothetical protein